jgi:competence protein ComEC
VFVFALALGVLSGVSWVQLQPELAGNALQLQMVISAIVSLAGLFPARRAPKLQVALIFCAALFLMVVWTSQWAAHQISQRLPESLDQQSVWLDVTVQDLPTRHERGWRFEARVNEARWSKDHPESISEFPPYGVLSWYQSPAMGDRESEPTAPVVALAPGQRWQLQVKVRRAAGTLNPGGFDLEAWMLEKKLYFNGAVQQGKRQPRPTRLNDADGLQIRIDQLRDRIRKSIERLIPNLESRHVLSALVVGDQRAISVADWALFQRTGVSHLMSISGLHVTMLAAIIGALGAAVWRLLCIKPFSVGLLVPVQSVAALSATVGAFGYAFLAGFAIPAQRTAWMLGIMAMARISGVRADPWAVISLALVVILIMDPMACLAPGFWLSFFAVAVLFGLHRQEDTAQAVKIGKADKTTASAWRVVTHRILSMVLTASHAQMAITFGLLPITVLFFQQVILVGPLANAIAIPVVSFVVTPLAMLGSLVSFFWDSPIIFEFAAAVVRELHRFLHWCAALSWAALDWPSPGNWRAVIASVGVAIALSSVLGRQLRHWRHLGWLTLLLLWSTPEPPPLDGQMQVTFIDVGQGSSVLVRTHQHQMLIDTGPSLGGSDAGGRIVMPVLRRLGIRSLDEIMISHFDDDHSAGLASVLAALPVRHLRSPEAPIDLSQAAIDLAPYPDLRRSACRAGQQWSWDGVHFQVLFPTEDDVTEAKAKKKFDRNAVSCVLRIQAARGESILLAGDLPAKQEKLLVKRLLQHRLGAIDDRSGDLGAELGADVLLAAHHGSKSSTSQEFLDDVRPRLVVIQSGFRNRYGHPHPDVLQRIIAPVVRTDRQGQIALRWGAPTDLHLTDRKMPQVTDFWRKNRRYWHIDRQPASVSDLPQDDPGP